MRGFYEYSATFLTGFEMTLQIVSDIRRSFVKSLQSVYWASQHQLCIIDLQPMAYSKHLMLSSKSVNSRDAQNSIWMQESGLQKSCSTKVSIEDDGGGTLNFCSPTSASERLLNDLYLKIIQIETGFIRMINTFESAESCGARQLPSSLKVCQSRERRDLLNRSLLYFEFSLKHFLGTSW